VQFVTNYYEEVELLLSGECGNFFATLDGFGFVLGLLMGTFHEDVLVFLCVYNLVSIGVKNVWS
jgi:hypothetical protein